VDNCIVANCTVLTNCNFDANIGVNNGVFWGGGNNKDGRDER